MRKSKPKSAISDNIKKYASISSIHGVTYIFDKTIPFFDRFLWLAIFIGSISLGSYMIFETVTNWQDNQVITTIKTVAKPVTSLAFPAVTICGSGQYMKLAEKAFYNNFLKWNKKRFGSETDGPNEAISEYLKEIFNIENGTNLFDILSTMTAPSSEASESNGIRQNQEACSVSEIKKRTQRSISEGNANSSINSMHVYFIQSQYGKRGIIWWKSSVWAVFI